MFAILVGIAGVVIGWLLKTLSDLMAERRANTRADVTWRREHYIDAVAILIHASRELMAADSAISRAINSLMNARPGGDQAIIDACVAENRAATERQLPWTTATIQALEAVRLYAPESVVEKADASWAAIHYNGRLPEATAIADFETGVMDALAELRAAARKSAGFA
jgi:hypothetical protein